MSLRWDDFPEKEKWKVAWGYMWRLWLVGAVLFFVTLVVLLMSVSSAPLR